MAQTSALQRLVKDEISLFSKDYEQYYLDGETKPRSIGEPFLLLHQDARCGVLLIHGLMAAPEEVREWGEFLFSQGYTVYAPRMAGHGTSAEDLAQRTVEDWAASIEQGHQILKTCCEKIIIAGFSTGGAMALYQVILHPDAYEAVISISAPLKFKKFSAHFAEIVDHWNRLSDFLINKSHNQIMKTLLFQKAFVTNHADNPHINYLRCPVSGIVQIKRLMKKVYPGLSSISIPSLIIHASDDPKVDVESGRAIYKRIASAQKIYKEIDFNLHGIVRGDIAKKVFVEVNGFLNSLTP
jgi:carboxylesterase